MVSGIVVGVHIKSVAFKKMSESIYNIIPKEYVPPAK
jgi:Mg2+/citrate symporter